MHADEIRFLYAYDRWATRRVLSVLDGLEPAVWMRTDVVGDGAWAPSSSTTWVASQRWRHGFQDTGEPQSRTRPAADDRPVARRVGTRVGGCRCLAADRDGRLRRVRPPGVPVWQMLVHVVNHGRSIEPKRRPFTPEGRSPGELDLINYAEAQAGDAGRVIGEDDLAPAKLAASDSERLQIGYLLDHGSHEPDDPSRMDTCGIEVWVVDGDIPATRAGAQGRGGCKREPSPVQAPGCG